MSTPKMGIPIPAGHENPFITAIGQTWDALDSWLQSLREDAALIVLSDGAPWTVDEVHDTVTWGSDLILASPDGAGAMVLAAGTAYIF